jgi:hypothetical protein
MIAAAAFILGFVVLWVALILLDFANPLIRIMLKTIRWPIHVFHKWRTGGYCEEHSLYFTKLNKEGHPSGLYGIGSPLCFICFLAKERINMSITQHEEETRREEEVEALVRLARSIDPVGDPREKLLPLKDDSSAMISTGIYVPPVTEEEKRLEAQRNSAISSIAWGDVDDSLQLLDNYDAIDKFIESINAEEMRKEFNLTKPQFTAIINARVEFLRVNKPRDKFRKITING